MLHIIYIYIYIHVFPFRAVSAFAQTAANSAAENHPCRVFAFCSFKGEPLV